MGKPKGSRNRLQPGMPGYDPAKNKPGRKPGQIAAKKAYKQLTDDEVLGIKLKILELIESGVSATLSDAARAAGVSPMRAYVYEQSDPSFRELVQAAREVRADRLEKDLSEHEHYVPKMMILRGDRERYKDNYKPSTEDSRTREILENLLKIAQSAPPEKGEVSNT